MRSCWIRVIGTILVGGQLHAAEPELQFVDRTVELGLEPANAAACWVDVNNDDWPELCVGGTVWRNDQGRGFSRLADGVNAVISADIDNDGYVDLYSTPVFKWFRNRDGKSFEAVQIPDLPRSISLGSAFADLDGDAFVDLYVGGYELWEANVTFPSLQLINVGGTDFRLKSTDDRFRARGVTTCDFDEDGDVDVYVSNYRLQPNRLWINDGYGVLADESAAKNALATSPGFPGGHSIGAVWGDFDNDGRFDLFAGNFAHPGQPQSRFLRNGGPGKGYVFDDLGPCGVHYQESYASPAAADYDNDGDLDLYFTTVYGVASFDVKNSPALFRSNGSMAFVDATATSGLVGLPATYEAAWADYDRDGDLDLATAGRLFENRAASGHWVEVQLIGDGKHVNRSAIGAQVRIQLTDRILTRQVEAGTGENNQNDLVLHFGLGEHSGPVTLQIAWPDGARQSREIAIADRFIEVEYMPQ